MYELSESYIASIDKIWPNSSSNINKEISDEYISSSFATNLENTGTLIQNELDFERALIADRKLRVLSKENPKFKTVRKKLRDLIEQYEFKTGVLKRKYLTKIYEKVM